jgi:CheY-like chemotaxis protein
MGAIKEPLRVLVAEDDEIDAFLLERAFTRAEVVAPVKFVRDGQEAVDYLSGESRARDRSTHPLPSLVLLDLKMPRLDGFDVLKWLRHDPDLRRLCVVVFTSSNEPTDVNLAYDLGANSYAVKPTDPASLDSFVRSLRDYWLERHCYPDCGATATHGVCFLDLSASPPT